MSILYDFFLYTTGNLDVLWNKTFWFMEDRHLCRSFVVTGLILKVGV